MHPKLALGSANFGMQYGVKESAQVSHAEIGKILSIAALSGVQVIDTAHLYGTALEELGRYHKLVSNRKFRIVTKVPRIPGKINFESILKLRTGFLYDLKRLRRGYIDTLMIHDASDLLRPGCDLVFDFLLNMKNLGFCDKIGVSVYDPYELDQITQRYHLDVCQFPHNVLDQRFNRKFLKRIKNRNVELHARSVFLQGLLLMEIRDIPMSLKTLLDVKKLRRLKELDTPLATSLNLVWQNDLIDHVIVGVNSTRELMEILQTYRKISAPLELREFATLNQKVINPSYWNL